MPVLSPQQALVIGFIVAPVIFFVLAYFTRATKRRILGALAGAFTYGLLDLVLDRLAFALGWWHYPSWEASGLVFFLYIPAGIVASAIGLIGWRMTRRFAWRGFLAFLAVYSVWGVIHDIAGSSSFADSNLMVFGGWIVPILGDLAVYAACTAASQAAMWFVAGAPDTEPSARSQIS